MTLPLPTNLQTGASSTIAAHGLLTSVFLEDDTLAANAEGHEGDMLHGLFLSRDTTSTALGPPRAQELPETKQDSIKDQTAKLFEPFFVVIEERTTGEHQHPHVHYVFSDDDPETLTNALLHDFDQPISLGLSSDDGAQADKPVKDRVFILDLDESGQNVVAAQSLSRHWQIARADINHAPTFNNAARTTDNGLMLKIVGVEQQDRAQSLSLSQTISEAGTYDDDALLNTLQSLLLTFQEEQAVLQQMTGFP